MRKTARNGRLLPSPSGRGVERRAESDIVRQHLLGLHRIDLADAEAARMIGENAVPQEVGQHALRAIGRDVGEALVVVLLELATMLLNVIEKEARKEPDADAEFEHMKLLRQRADFLGFEQRGDKDFRRMARERAVVVDHERDGRRVGDEGFVAALAEVFLAEIPFERLGEGDEVLHNIATVGISEDFFKTHAPPLHSTASFGPHVYVNVGMHQPKNK